MMASGNDRIAVPTVVVHLLDLPAELAPVKATTKRDWWQLDPKTRNHAYHCLPVSMASSLGYYILAPGDFCVSWDGDCDSDVIVETPAGGTPCPVDNHSASASFTVQPGFIPVTGEVGDFIFIKGIANQRGPWFTAIEALIEAWWQPGEFGIVCMMNRKGNFTVSRGEPIAQMCVYRSEAGFASLSIDETPPPETAAWRDRRSRPGYRKDLDYLFGRHPDGTNEATHIRSWSTHGVPSI